MTRFLLLPALILACLCATAQADDQFKFYAETVAFVNWIDVSPEVEITQEATPRDFTAVVVSSGKLNSFGLPVRLGDVVEIRAAAAHTFQVSHGSDSVSINTMDKIPLEFYPQFRY